MPIATPCQALEVRRLPRTALSVDVSLTSDSHFYAGLSGDVARGGLFVASYRPLHVGDVVDLELDLPMGVIQARGVVRWVRELTEHASRGFGVSLEGLDDEARRAIGWFCEQRAPLYYDCDESLAAAS